MFYYFILYLIYYITLYYILAILHCTTTVLHQSLSEQIYLYYYIFLFNVDVIILCMRLSENTMSIVGRSPRLLQAASTAEHVSL